MTPILPVYGYDRSCMLERAFNDCEIHAVIVDPDDEWHYVIDWAETWRALPDHIRFGDLKVIEATEFTRVIDARWYAITNQGPWPQDAAKWAGVVTSWWDAPDDDAEGGDA